MRLQSLIAMLSEFPMIHLVRSPSHSDSRAQSSAPNPIAPSGSVVRLFPKSTLQPLENQEGCDAVNGAVNDSVNDSVNDTTNDMTNDTLASRALVVLEDLGETYPIETSSPAVAPVMMSPSMEEMYQYLTVQKVTFDSPALKTTVLETPQPLPADTKFLYAYPQQFLQAPALPVRSQHRLPALPFLEMGSGLLAFTIVSGVVVADGLKQAKNTPAPGKKAAPISSIQTDRAKRSTPVSVAMSDMEILKSGRTLPLPANAVSAPLGSGTSLTPAQMSQLAMQQAIAASQIGQGVEPPPSIIPPLKTFAPPQTAGPVNPAPVQQPREEAVKPQPPISMTPPPPVRSVPIVQESIAPKLPVPQIPISRSSDVPVPPPVAVTEPSPVPTPTPMSPTVQQSMVPTSSETPAANVPILEVAPRQMQSEQPEALPTGTTQEKAMVPEAPLTLTPRVLSSMRPEIQEDVVAPKAPMPTVNLEVTPKTEKAFEPKDLVFNRETSAN